MILLEKETFDFIFLTSSYTFLLPLAKTSVNAMAFQTIDQLIMSCSSTDAATAIHILDGNSEKPGRCEQGKPCSLEQCQAIKALLPRSISVNEMLKFLVHFNTWTWDSMPIPAGFNPGQLGRKRPYPRCGLPLLEDASFPLHCVCTAVRMMRMKPSNDLLSQQGYFDRLQAAGDQTIPMRYLGQLMWLDWEGDKATQNANLANSYQLLQQELNDRKALVSLECLWTELWNSALNPFQLDSIRILECESAHIIVATHGAPPIVTREKAGKANIADLCSLAWQWCEDGVSQCSQPGCDSKVWVQYQGFHKTAPAVIFLHFRKGQFAGPTTPTRVRCDAYIVDPVTKNHTRFTFFYQWLWTVIKRVNNGRLYHSLAGDPKCLLRYDPGDNEGPNVPIKRFQCDDEHNRIKVEFMDDESVIALELIPSRAHHLSWSGALYSTREARGLPDDEPGEAPLVRMSGAWRRPPAYVPQPRAEQPSVPQPGTRISEQAVRPEFGYDSPRQLQSLAVTPNVRGVGTPSQSRGSASVSESRRSASASGSRTGRGRGRSG